MENITYITDKDGNEHVIIDHGNEQFTSMLKTTYDAQLEEQANDQSI